MHLLLSAKAEGKAKKVETLTAKLESIVAKKKHITGLTPVVRRLQHGDMISKLWLRLFSLQVKYI
jgi:hypothetical protein